MEAPPSQDSMRSQRSVWRSNRENDDDGNSRSSHTSRRSRRARQHRPPRIRPNFFVGFRITSKEIIAQIEELQRNIAQAFPDLVSCLVDPRTLHVTLCVLHLKDTEGKLQCKRNFGAPAAPEFEFKQLHAQCYSCGLTTEPFRHPYLAHVTIWKTSNDRDGIKRLNHARNVQRVPPAEFTDTVQNALCDFLTKHYVEGQEAITFGRESPLSIELLAMGEKEDDGTPPSSIIPLHPSISYMFCASAGYYKAYASVPLQF
ncbi:hypothetical protein FI667_g5637, partial [Globisporangium splendens]